MAQGIDENSLAGLLSTGVRLDHIEPHIFSVLPDIDVASSYDKKFGSIYDRVACNRVYNRLVWGYSTSKFAALTREALRSAPKGRVLDLGCGSLAFTAATYIRYSKRPVILLDRSLKLLRMAKSKIIKLNGKIPGNMVFLHGDAIGLPFDTGTFQTVISLNLMHVVDDVDGLLAGVGQILADGGKGYFTTLIRENRLADKYLDLWENAGEVVSRTMDQISAAFDALGMPAAYDINGNMTFIRCG